MKDTKAWSQKIQEDKNFAKGYKGLTSVKDILKKAKADGYNLKESDITKEDMKALEAVAGGNGLFDGGMPGMDALPGMGGNSSGGGPTASAGQVAVSAQIGVDIQNQKFAQNMSSTEGSTIGNQTSVQMNQGRGK